MGRGLDEGFEEALQCVFEGLTAAVFGLGDERILGDLVLRVLSV